MNPDYEIEQFWLSFKKSMINFYNQYNLQHRPIDLWSDKLNELQNKKLYLQIEEKIRNYLTLYAIDVMRFNQNIDSFHIHILITNIKRYKKLCNISVKVKYHNIIFMLVDIYKSMCKTEDKSIVNIFNQLELFILYEDFTVLIEYAIKNNLPSILNNINTQYDLKNILFEMYNIDFGLMSFDKIIKKLK